MDSVMLVAFSSTFVYISKDSFDKSGSDIFTFNAATFNYKINEN